MRAARTDAEVRTLLEERRILMREGTIIDATIIAAPPSTKNAAHARDPEMHQTKKGNQWHFGMKAHIGVDASSGHVHSLSTTAANVADVAHAHTVLHGAEQPAFADARYQGVEKPPQIRAQHPDVGWYVAPNAAKSKPWPRADGQHLPKRRSAESAG